MNKVIQTVTLGQDPEVKTYGTDNKTTVSFSGAVNKKFAKEGEPNADWFKYTAFGATADFIAKYFKKGSKILITGSVENNNYEKNGQKIYGTKIIISDAEFYGKKSDNEATESGSSNNAAQQSPATTQAESTDDYDNF